jgi:hypothetical protein
MENRRKTVRSYTISEIAFNYLKEEAELQKRSASFILDEILNDLALEKFYASLQPKKKTTED